jgi:dTDP-4-amino-4,6-dideoxygalactose transaminase
MERGRMSGDRCSPMASFIPFNRPYSTGREFEYIREAIERAHLASDGVFSRRCEAWLAERIGCRKALLTNSCTAALEMTALLAEIKPGDEVVMPSYTFVSTANAFVLRGGIPVFVDIRPDTLNIDERAIEPAITSKTRAIVPVHYAGVACEMDEILSVAREHRLLVVEDAAQALGSTYRGRPLGAIGDLAATSFHETKNVISGEGGALLINRADLMARAEIVREKGTDRRRFFRGEVDKYTWMDVGSSYGPSELTAAFLWAQLEAADAIGERRLEVWHWYNAAFAELERQDVLRRPCVPPHCRHNAHMFYVIVSDPATRSRLLTSLNGRGINAVFHYVPLHSSVAGRTVGRACGPMVHTDSISERLVRLPLWIGMTESDVDRVVSTVADTLS